jgi:hypothetical protein
LYVEALGLPLTAEGDGYLHSEDIDGCKSFGGVAAGSARAGVLRHADLAGGEAGAAGERRVRGR